MATLKQVIKYTNANAIEATWVDVVQKGSVDPETGETIYHNEEVVIRSHAYADVQMQDFRDDVAKYGGDIAEYEKLISDVESAIVPAVPKPPQPVQCSPWQIRKALNAQGLREAVETAVAAASIEIQDGWSHAEYFRSDDAFVIQFSKIIGKDPVEFITYAATL